MSVMTQRAIVWSALSLAACLVAGEAPAGDASAPLSDQGRCRALGEGFFAVRGSDGCVRISGYVEAGAGFETSPHGALAPGPLQAPTAPIMRTGAGAALDARVDTPMGPMRTYIEVGSPRFNP